MPGHPPSPSDLFAAAICALEGLTDAGLSHLGPSTPPIPQPRDSNPSQAAAVEICFLADRPETYEGESGELFSRILSQGLRLLDDQVLRMTLADVENRASTLQQQAKLFIALGEAASQFILQSSDDLLTLRGRLHPVTAASSTVLCTDHPADMVRDPSIKANCWKDLLVGMQHLGLRPPPAR